MEDEMEEKLKDRSDKLARIIDERDETVRRRHLFSLVIHMAIVSLAISLNRFFNFEPLDVLVIAIGLLFVQDLAMISYRTNTDTRFESLLISMGVKDE